MLYNVRDLVGHQTPPTSLGRPPWFFFALSALLDETETGHHTHTESCAATKLGGWYTGDDLYQVMWSRTPSGNPPLCAATLHYWAQCSNRPMGLWRCVGCRGRREGLTGDTGLHVTSLVRQRQPHSVNSLLHWWLSNVLQS